MTTKLIILATFLLLELTARAQSVSARRDLPKFMGREVTITEPALDDTGFFPKGPASICLQGPPQRQCYTAPKDFGDSPTVNVVEFKKGVLALLFSAASGGVSSRLIHLALLRPGTGKDLEDLLATAVTSVSNQNQYEFWDDVTISDAQIFVTADYVWGPDEGHYAEHRYILSSYVLKPRLNSEDGSYYLDDRYMTARKYDLESGVGILASEKQEILARLKRAKAAAEPRQQAPR